jgi:thioredoxin reductase
VITNNTQFYNVVIIGSGPAGLSAAITLKQLGFSQIVVLERESEAGGIPRHCGHPPFGFKEYKQILTGPKYATNNVAKALSLGVEIRLNTTVTSLEEGGQLTVTSNTGLYAINAKRVLIATGTREAPRSTRLTSGDRALGICNTGALQSMVYLKGSVPFKRPVIIGTEIVSFSALMTCKKGAIKPVAMIEEQLRPSVRWPFYYGAAVFGVKLLTNTKLTRIIAKERVQAVEVSSATGKTSQIECDGVLFTGKFTPESNLIRMSHIVFDNNFSPITDDLGRCSDPAYYVAGNIIQLSPADGRNPWFYTKKRTPNAVNISGICWDQGRQVARNIASDLQ